MPDEIKSPPVALLETPLPDAEFAEALRAQLRPVLEQACKIMDSAGARGMIVGWQLGLMPPGKNVIQQINIQKIL